MSEDDALISILSSHVWENGHPHLYKSERFQCSFIFRSHHHFPYANINRAPSHLISSHLISSLPFTSLPLTSLLFISPLFTSFPLTSLFFTSFLPTTSLILSLLPLVSQTSKIFPFTLYARKSEFQISDRCSRCTEVMLLIASPSAGVHNTIGQELPL